MGEVSFKDKDILQKAFKVLEKEMSLTEYTRFLQLIGPTGGDVTKELAEKRKRFNVDKAYEKFLKRIKMTR